MQREVMEFDVVIVGAGPAGLAAACRLAQLSREQERETSICVLEKGAEVGAHILSGALLEPTALEELFPDWKERGAPLHTPVQTDQVRLLSSAKRALPIPAPFVPHTLHNRGNFIISLGNFCRWLASQAEELGVEVLPGFAAAQLLYGADNTVQGVLTGDMGRDRQGNPRQGYTPGMELRARYTLVAEGSRGHLGKELIERFSLARGRDPQHYAIGLKELWQIPPEEHRPGLVVHTLGWPLLPHGAAGGGFLYHLENHQVAVGLVMDLNYKNPHLNPYEEFQLSKQHPLFKKYLAGGERISYGARSITKGGLQSLPRMDFPGGLLIGCDAGTLNFAKIKGSHTAMKSGMIAAETVFRALSGEDAALESFGEAFQASWAYRELHQQRNFGPLQHKLGNLFGSACAFVDLNLLRGRLPLTLRDRTPDHAGMKAAARCRAPHYPKPDKLLSFDKLSSVYLSNTNHEEDQPCHLLLEDAALPVAHNLPHYDEPAQRYCPAGVYEIVRDGDGEARFQINAQNCIHCKTCDIKEPAQNIRWIPPEGGGGPNYPNM